MKIFSDTKRVGQNISTKSVTSNRRMNITDSYKHREGTKKERAVFKYAITRDYSRDETEETEEAEEPEENGGTEEPAENGGTEEEEQSGGTAQNGVVNGNETPTSILPPPEVSMRFEEVSKLVNGEDVRLNLVLHSESSVARPLSIIISVWGMRYNGSPVASIQTDVKQETLLPGKDLSIPILVPFSAYHKHMQECDSMRVSAIVTDKKKSDETYLAENDIVLLDPPVSINVVGQTRLNHEASAEVIFTNTVKETLKECTLTVSGSGLLRREFECRLPDLRPNTRIRIKFPFVPYKIGEKTLVADFDCSTFRNAKGSSTVYVRP